QKCVGVVEDTPAVATNCRVVDEMAVVDHQRPGVVNAAATAVAELRGVWPSGVASEGATGDGQRPEVKNAATEYGGDVAVERASGNGQRPGIEDAATVRRHASTDG